MEPMVVGGEMSSHLLVFKAARDIQAFEGELLWHYKVGFCPLTQMR